MKQAQLKKKTTTCTEPITAVMSLGKHLAMNASTMPPKHIPYSK